MIIGDRLLYAKRKGFPKGTSKSARACFVATFLALKTATPFQPSRPWKRWLGRSKFPFINCSMTAMSRPRCQVFSSGGRRMTLPGVAPAKMRVSSTSSADSSAAWMRETGGYSSSWLRRCPDTLLVAKEERCNAAYRPRPEFCVFDAWPRDVA